jgi:hypothetical protein
MDIPTGTLIVCSVPSLLTNVTEILFRTEKIGLVRRSIPSPMPNNSSNQDTSFHPQKYRDSVQYREKWSAQDRSSYCSRKLFFTGTRSTPWKVINALEYAAYSKMARCSNFMLHKN